MTSNEIKNRLQECCTNHDLAEIYSVLQESINDDVIKNGLDNIKVNLQRLNAKWDLSCKEIGNTMLPVHSFALLFLRGLEGKELTQSQEILRVNRDKITMQLLGTYPSMINDHLNKEENKP